ncbi:MAG: methionine synthase [Phycisphaerae bacterium]|nr:methionine synthase [Phycisphaerae bacterium]
MTSPLLQALARRVLVLDGAMGTTVHTYPLTVEKDYCGCENCTDVLVRSRPDIVQEIHEGFLAAGADAVETNTFGANRLVLCEFGLQEESYALNKRGAEIARAACVKHHSADKPRFVLGSMGPGTRLITLGNTNWAEMLGSYKEQALGLIDGSADAFLVETCQDLLQIKCAVNACLAALAERGKSPDDIPIMVSVTIETTGSMLLGTEIAAVASALAGYPIASLGLNCATGPTEMTPHVQWLGRHWGAMGVRPGRCVSVVPNAGLPVLHEGRTEYPLKPEPFVEALVRMVEEDGVGIVGGCCGTTAAHIGLLARTLESTGLARRGTRGPAHASVGPAPSVTSLYAPQEYRQDNSIFIIGERMNASGSRAFKRLLEAEDFDGIVSLAREQVRHDGAHALDLNVDYAGRDNARDMSEVVKRVVRQVNAPLMLDSTQLATLEAGLRHAGGKCIINSANFEDGDDKFDQVCGLAATYGAALVIGSIDEDKEASMARTAERKLAIAERGFRRAVERHGLAPCDLLFDPLVLPISTGMESDRRSALETIEGVRRIMRRFPECQTTVGLSNVSFGLKPAARVVLNSAFLHELREAGLTSAILHFSKILPRNKIPASQWDAALDLIYDRRGKDGRGGFDPLQAFIEMFKDAEVTGTAAKRAAAELTLEERLRAHIIDGEKEGLAATLDEALTRYAPLDIINDHLLDGMKTVGELFGSGQMQLPFVLQSAEVMKMAVARLEPLMERVAGQTKGTIVLATVKGDVHDIGKNLVDIILSNNGFTVVNLGIKQPIADILKAWREHKADAIGMSGLLVKSVNVMEENLNELNAQGVRAPVLLGGAALTRHYCEHHLRGVYRGKVYYGRDAFEGLATMERLVTGRAHEIDSEIAERLDKRARAEATVERSDRATRAAALEAEARSGTATVAPPRRSAVSRDVAIPTPPFWGERLVPEVELERIYPFINTVALFRGQWQFKKGAQPDEEYEALVADEVTPIFERLKARCRDQRLLKPAVVYGYFPCHSQGDDLVIYDPGSPADRIEIERFSFPRQSRSTALCISDFFRPVGSGAPDVIGLHCVTMGHEASRAAQELFARNDYAEYLYLHGMGVECAEALAEMWHKRMRQELGIAGEDSPRIRELFTQKYRGSRYSFGYPACPEMADQEKLFRLLKPERIGCTLTDNWQIVPEQSTTAIIVHHPEAKYFSV